MVPLSPVYAPPRAQGPALHRLVQGLPHLVTTVAPHLVESLASAALLQPAAEAELQRVRQAPGLRNGDGQGSMVFSIFMANLGLLLLKKYRLALNRFLQRFLWEHYTFQRCTYP